MPLVPAELFQWVEKLRGFHDELIGARSVVANGLYTNKRKLLLATRAKIQHTSETNQTIRPRLRIWNLEKNKTLTA